MHIHSISTETLFKSKIIKQLPSFLHFPNFKKNKETLRKPCLINSNSPKGISQSKIRSPSGVFTQLTSTQINELKESFSILDKDGNGIIGKEDLQAMLISLGQDPSSSELSYMLSLIPGPLNFAAYLTFFSTHLSLLSPREEIINAFQTFDENNSGKINFLELKDALMSMGSRMSEDQVDKALKQFLNGTNVLYRDFIDALAGTEEKEND
ncbi:hypothetical protein PCANB_001188 [Pneumocystis canis]|nr:hypothetical protein PCK1_001237 [Pneumocystis canis]KAG5437067.1 hypothetical protein PCANB_001188 [Pneumocystis canis]